MQKPESVTTKSLALLFFLLPSLAHAEVHTCYVTWTEFPEGGGEIQNMGATTLVCSGAIPPMKELQAFRQKKQKETGHVVLIMGWTEIQKELETL